MYMKQASIESHQEKIKYSEILKDKEVKKFAAASAHIIVPKRFRGKKATVLIE